MARLISPTGSKVNVPDAMAEALIKIGWVRDKGAEVPQRPAPMKATTRRTRAAAKDNGGDGDVRDSG